MKFNDEDLSRLLSAHAGNQLRQGFSTATTCCTWMAGPEARDDYNELRKTISEDVIRRVVRWNDANYNPGWPLGKFLRELERQGLA